MYVMDHICLKLKSRCRRATAGRTGPEFGIRIRLDEEPFPNLRFADDSMRFAQSKADADKMSLVIITTSIENGLNVHETKTELLTWEHLAYVWQPMSRSEILDASSLFKTVIPTSCDTG